MSEDLDAPTRPELIYAFQLQVPLYWPLMQGDVFTDVALPGVGSTTGLVQVVMHPCSMRKGAGLSERITVAPISTHSTINANTWKRYARIMPLPDLREDGHDYATEMVDISSVAATELCLQNRVASLSNLGIQILQQRIIYFHTRLKVDLPTLQEQSAPILTEAELQADWVETALDNKAESDLDDVIAKSGIEQFHAWLDEGNRERRGRLQRSTEHADLRREARAEAKQRYRM